MKLKNKIRAALHNLLPDYKDSYLKVSLKGGLCNKLLCLFSACDIAIEQGATLVEPEFGWKEAIRFSDIYDLAYFNKQMRPFNQGKDIMVSFEEFTANAAMKKQARRNFIDLWSYSEKVFSEQRETGIINRNTTKTRALAALRLRPELKALVDSYSANSDTVVQVRTESDWVKYAGKKQIDDDNETLLIDLDTLVSLLADFKPEGQLFFTSGDNHAAIRQALKAAGMASNSYFSHDYEYEVVAAINFEICCAAKVFIGLSRSSYSSLIAYKRAVILNTDHSFIYNCNHQILRRVDMGLHAVGRDALEKRATIV